MSEQQTFPFHIVVKENIPVGWLIGVGDGEIVINVRGEQLNLSLADIGWQSGPASDRDRVTVSRDALEAVVRFLGKIDHCLEDEQQALEAAIAAGTEQPR